MIIFHYRPDTFEYVGRSEARKSPKEDGVYLIPANATVVEPSTASGVVPVWDPENEAWVQVEDHRGVSGWLDGKEFTMEDLGPLPEGFSLEAPVIPAAPITSVTIRQAKLALLQAGLIDDIEAYIESIEDVTTKRAAQIEWNHGSTFERDNPLFQQVTSGLGMTEEQVDELFIIASAL